MKIDLSREMQEHLVRVKKLAHEAEENLEEESFSSRASALRSMSELLRELTKSQAEVVNMQRLLAVESAVIDTANKHLDSLGKQALIDNLQEVLGEEG